MERGKRIAGLFLFALLLFSTSCQDSESQMKQEWKALNDTISICSQKISNIVKVMQLSNHTTEATQRQLLHDIDSIDRRMKDAIERCAKRNKDNELGRYIRENYKRE